MRKTTGRFFAERKLSFARQLFEPLFRDNDRYLHNFMPYSVAVDDYTLATKDGELLSSVLVRGYPADVTSDEILAAYCRNLEDLFAGIDGKLAVYINKIVAPTGVKSAVMDNNDFASEIDRRWSKSFDLYPSMKRYSLVTFGIRPSMLEKLASTVTGDMDDRSERDRLVELLDRVSDAFVKSFESAGTKRLQISTGELLGYHASIQSGEYYPINYDHQFGLPVSYLMTDRDFLFRSNSFLVRKANGDQEFGAVLSLKNYPSPTIPGIFDGIDIASKMVISHSFLPLTDEIAKQKTALVKRQLEASDGYAETLKAELYELLDALSSKRATLGEHHCSVTVFADSKKDLREIVAEIVQASQINGGLFKREDLAQRSVFMAQFPGASGSFKARSGTIPSLAFAELAAFHERPEGRFDGVPWGKPVTFIRTLDQDNYAFNFHLPQQSENELTRGHALVIGPSGSGKTLSTLFLASQAMRFGTRIFAFDKDKGMEIGLRAMGADYTQVKVGAPTGLNPFSSEIDHSGVSWLAGFIEQLAFDNGEASPAQKREIIRAVEENARMFNEDQEHLCTFSKFISHFKSNEDGGDLFLRLNEWVDGKHGWVFNGDGFDPLANPDKSVGFDVTELFNDQRVRTSWLNYIFHRIERLCDDGRPTLILLDEGWHLLDDPKFSTWIGNWYRTLRKKNAIVCLMSQDPTDITKSACANEILTNCATKILFRSPENIVEDYLELGLTLQEASLLKPSTMRREALILSGNDKLLVDMDLGVLGPCLDLLGGGTKIRKQLPKGYKSNPNFWRQFV
ncbi:MAG: hypothetical protein AAF429_09165 [Pseudomonadota bacterium]